MLRRIAFTAVSATVLSIATAGAASAAPSSPPVGSPSPSASCVAALTDYLAHYDQNGQPEHGVGSILSADAHEFPGNVGEFNRFISQLHGALPDCVS